MAVLRGCVVGDSQVKFLNETRLYMGSNCATCTFSFGDARAPRLVHHIRHLLPGLDFIAIYVGGNDLSITSSEEEISDNIKHVLECASHVAEKVFWFKIPPRKNDDNNMMQKRRRVNSTVKNYIATANNMICIILEDKFIGSNRSGKPEFYAADGYHVSRGLGIKALSKALSLAVRVAFRGKWQPCGGRHPNQLWRILRCTACGECKKQWQYLRDKFLREIRIIEKAKSGSAATQKKLWSHFQMLPFLRGYVSSRRRILYDTRVNGFSENSMAEATAHAEETAQVCDRIRVAAGSSAAALVLFQASTGLFMP
ncbi:uncharacterized protein LOC119383704 [Rhipicephalus sanguineus]|uniref:uncharacterized protein LOC119383704 n=1 Tax=Rhipicephalus sanguineus TaxID=34632 RepID=UPI0020C308E6|nr:uncharacterized protein LOC119383704 [Rhipicephalus sanguineus]